MTRGLNCISSLLIAICFAAGLISCAHLNSEKGKQERLRKRIDTEWHAKVKKDWATVYDLTTEAFKKKMDKTTFVTGANINITEFSVKDVDIQESGKARVNVKYKINQQGYDFNLTSKEEWLWENGDWYLNLLPILAMPIDKKKS